MLSLLPQPAVLLGRSVPALPMKGRELKNEGKEQISLIWAVSPVPRAPGCCSHLPIAARKPLPGKCRKMCLNPASFPEPSQGDAVAVPGRCQAGAGGPLPRTPLASLNSPAGICRRVLSASSSVLEEETSTVGATGWVLQGGCYSVLGAPRAPQLTPLGCGSVRAGKLRHGVATEGCAALSRLGEGTGGPKKPHLLLSPLPSPRGRD